MAIFKCKMCGGELEITSNTSIVECPYCETKQTLPKLDTERKVSLYERANHFRRNNEFDKAMAVYEMILNEDDTDSEAYWSIVLCRYGIEYVKDPQTHKRIPTVNRTQYTSIFSDTDYLKAIELANDYQRSILKKEAEQIDYIQKSILEISSKEEPFDIFICYKETGFDGQRTQDSVYAQDIYNKLTEEGYKVFFSRITLEDKIGMAYEPYIFAALNSAKVMLVIGTQKEYFNAVWVKNEWSRYISLVKQGEKKNIIPLYKDIDPYELPVEFSYLQSVNMNTVGFMQDLARGINKLIKPTQSIVNGQSIQNLDSHIVKTSIERAFDLLSKCDYENADLSLNTAKGYDPSKALIYVGKIMVTNKISTKEQLSSLKKPLEEDDNFKLALKYADINLQQELEEYNKATLYNYADTLKPKNAIKIFERLEDYKDSKEKLALVRKKARNKKNIKLAILSCVVVIVAFIALNFNTINEKYIIPYQRYQKAVELLEDKEKSFKNYADAIKILEELNGFSNSEEMIKEAKYLYAKKLQVYSRFSDAIEQLSDIVGYKDADELLLKNMYSEAIRLENHDINENMYNSKYLDYFKICAEANYENSKERYETLLSKGYLKTKDLIRKGEIRKAVGTLSTLAKHDYKDSKALYEKYK